MLLCNLEATEMSRIQVRLAVVALVLVFSSGRADGLLFGWESQDLPCEFYQADPSGAINPQGDGFTIVCRDQAVVVNKTLDKRGIMARYPAAGRRGQFYTVTINGWPVGREWVTTQWWSVFSNTVNAEIKLKSGMSTILYSFTMVKGDNSIGISGGRVY
jgi:hypothetical protein